MNIAAMLRLCLVVGCLMVWIDQILPVENKEFPSRFHVFIKLVQGGINVTGTVFVRSSTNETATKILSALKPINRLTQPPMGYRDGKELIAQFGKGFNRGG